LNAAGVTTGPIFRAINKAQRIGKSGFSPKVIWAWLRLDARNVGWRMLLRTIFAAHVRVCAMKLEGNWSRSSFCSVM
jgi:hypothetical protein